MTAAMTARIAAGVSEAYIRELTVAAPSRRRPSAPRRAPRSLRDAGRRRPRRPGHLS
jgi:hypothetical protein